MLERLVRGYELRWGMKSEMSGGEAHGLRQQGREFLLIFRRFLLREAGASASKSLSGPFDLMVDMDPQIV